jgi:hypothetical protein
MRDTGHGPLAPLIDAWAQAVAARNHCTEPQSRRFWEGVIAGLCIAITLGADPSMKTYSATDAVRIGSEIAKASFA